MPPNWPPILAGICIIWTLRLHSSKEKLTYDDTRDVIGQIPREYVTLLIWVLV